MPELSTVRFLPATGIAAAAASLVLLAACGAGPTPIVASAGPSVGVALDKTITRTHEAMSLLVDRNRAATVYMSEAELQTGQCRFNTSTDGAMTWVRGTAPSLAPYSNCSVAPGQPQNIRTELKQAPDGTLYYLYHAHDPVANDGTQSVFLGRSKDGGRTWAVSPVDLAPKPAASDPIERNFEAHMALDPDKPSTIYATWRRSYWNGQGGHSAGPITRAWMSVSSDGGASFGTPFRMFDRNPGFDAPRPIVVAGKLYAFWRESAPAVSATVPLPLTTIWASVSSDQGKTWTDNKIAEAPDASEPVALYDTARRKFDVAWHDNRNHDLDAFFSQSSDATAWSAPQRLNDDKANSRRAGQYYPQLALSASGRLDAAWYDFRNDPYAAPKPDGKASFLNLSSNLSRQQDVYYSFSMDGGKTWSPNLKVNDLRIDRTRGTWNGQYFFVVPLSLATIGDKAILAWSDTRNGDSASATQDIFAGVVGVGPAPVATSSSDWLIPVLVVLGAFGIGAGIALFAATAVLRRRQGRGEAF